MGLFDLFRKQKSDDRKPKAMAFVDYEHWYYSYQSLFGMKPDVTSWRDELTRNYEVLDIMVFAEFSKKGIHEELTKLRNITNTIIETHQQTGHHKKDMTDFIMLDYIYQAAATRSEIDTFILFTGDGHFHSVAKYLSQRLGRSVIIYGVKGAFSTQLRAVATEAHELPDDETTYMEYAKLIVENLDYVSTHPKIISTFNGTVTTLMRKHDGLSEELLRQSLQRMLSDGLIHQKMQPVDFNRKVKVLAPDWEALHDAGLWEYDK